MDRRGFLKLVGGVAAGALSPLSLKREDIVIANGTAPKQQWFPFRLNYAQKKWLRTESSVPFGVALEDSWVGADGNEYCWVQYGLTPSCTSARTVRYTFYRNTE